MNWSKITLENYAAIDALNRHTPSDYIQHSVSLLSLVTNKPESYFENLPLAELHKQIAAMVAFLRNEPEGKLYKSFWFKWRRFKVRLTQDEVTTGQAMSVSALKLTGETMAVKLPELMAAICEETKFPFRKPLTFAQKVDAFKQLPSSTGIGICLFFWEVSKELQESSLAYLEREGMKLKQMLES